MNPFRTVSLALLLVPTLAFADPGVALKLSWDHCAGDGYVGDRSFACDTNTGAETLWLSMVIQDGIERTSVAAVQMIVDLRTTSASLPSWWQTGNGQCRAGAIRMRPETPAASGGCLPWFGDDSSLPLSVFQPQAQGDALNTLRLNCGTGVPSGNEVILEPGIEYLLTRFEISHAKSVGTGACAGCLVPTCIGFGQLIIERPTPPEFEWCFGGPVSSVTWQGAFVTSFTPTYDFYSRYHHANLECSTGPVPAQNHTWGSIKSMYR